MIIISIAAVRARLRAVWQWLVDAADRWRRTARSGADDAWVAFKERFRAAAWQAWSDLVDAGATATKEAFGPTPQGHFPPAL